MWKKFKSSFAEFANHYMEVCANNNIYGVYVDMVREDTEE